MSNIIIYHGDYFKWPTTHFETLLGIYLKKYAKKDEKILFIPSNYIGYVLRILNRISKGGVIILNFDFTKYNMFIYNVIIELLIILIAKIRKNKTIVIWHGPGFYDMYQIKQWYYVSKINLFSLLFLYFLSKIIQLTFNYLADIIIAFTLYDKQYLRRALIIPHGVPGNYKFLCSKNAGNGLIYFGTITPRKPLHIMIREVKKILKKISTNKIIILSTIKRRNRMYYIFLKNLFMKNNIEIQFIELKSDDLETRIKFLCNSYIIIPHCFNNTPVYTLWEALAFTSYDKIILPTSALCQQNIKSYINFIERYKNINIENISKILYELIKNYEIY